MAAALRFPRLQVTVIIAHSLSVDASLHDTNMTSPSSRDRGSAHADMEEAELIVLPDERRRERLPGSAPAPGRTHGAARGSSSSRELRDLLRSIQSRLESLEQRMEALEQRMEVVEGAIFP